MAHPKHQLRRTRSIARDDRGISLVELLIALCVTLVVGGTALGTVVHTYRTSINANAMTDVNQNLRVAVNIVQRDLMQTGLEIPVGGIGIPTGTAVPVMRPAAGTEIALPAGWQTLPAITPGPDLGAVINGTTTDIVTVLRSDVLLPWEDAPVVTVAAEGDRITFPVDFPIDDADTGIKAGDLIMLSSAVGSTLMEATDVAGQTVTFDGTAVSNLNQPDAPAGSIMRIRIGGAFVGVIARRILMVTYYLDTAGDSPALIRRINYGEPRKIAVGIEDLQLTWDLVDGDTDPSGVDEPDLPNTPHQIRKANLQMSGRSFIESTFGGYLRSNVSTQIALRSLAFVDRYR
jgi:Tfp pilus assembly protein PilW